MENLDFTVNFTLMSLIIVLALIVVYLLKPLPERNKLMNRINLAKSIQELESITPVLMEYLANKQNKYEDIIFFDLYKKKHKRLEKKERIIEYEY